LTGPSAISPECKILPKAVVFVTTPGLLRNLPSVRLAEGVEVTNGLEDARCPSTPSVWCRYANMRRGRFRTMCSGRVRAYLPLVKKLGSACRLSARLLSAASSETSPCPQFPPNTEQRTQFPRLAPFHNNLWHEHKPTVRVHAF
jgi:hypothetical protein